jgi:hypothetical protein
MTAPGSDRIDEILKYAAMLQQVASIFAPKYNKGVTLAVAAAKIAAQVWNDAHPDEPAVVLPSDAELISALLTTAKRGEHTGLAFLDEDRL